VAVAAGLFALILSCHGPAAGGAPDREGHVSISAVIQRHSAELLEIPGVVGVAEGAKEGHPIVQVLVVRRTPDVLARLPGTLEGYSVVVVESGELRSQDGDRQ
jgi:hypothetical protein